MYTLIALLFITYYLKLPYHLWKASHILLGIPLLFATIHVILIPSDTTLYLPLKIWLMSLLTFAGLAYVYRRFLYSFIGPRYNYKVAYTVDRGMVLDIYLKPDGKRKLSHNPGQFIYVSFKNPALAKEKHPYTISSEPSSDYLRISVKSLGDYTSTLKNLKVDDGATVFGPYGSFGEKSIVQKKPQIWIAGGIGITPFLSLLQHHIKNNSAAAITMFYCTKNQQEAVYLQDMMQLVSTSSNIKIVPFYSELQSYLNVEKIGQVVSAFRDSNIFLCGPAPMMHGLADQLNKAGVNSRNIVFEDFNYK
jgi:predicted ferric reductase